MTNSKSFDGVTPQVWDCIKAISLKEHSTVYQATGTNKGTATTKVKFVGTIVLDFDYDADKEVVTYNIQEKPPIVKDSKIWDGIQASIEGCRGK